MTARQRPSHARHRADSPCSGAFRGAGLSITAEPLLHASVQEKLRFPSGTATAKVIRMLHGGAALDEADEPHPHAVCTLPVVGEVGRHA